MGGQYGTITSENSLVVPLKLDINLSYYWAILLLVTYPTEIKTYIHKKTCTLVCTAPLFVTAKK